MSENVSYNISVVAAACKSWDEHSQQWIHGGKLVSI